MSEFDETAREPDDATKATLAAMAGWERAIAERDALRARVVELEEQLEAAKDSIWLLQNKVGDRADDMTGLEDVAIPIQGIWRERPERSFEAPPIPPVRQRRRAAEALRGKEG